MTHLGQNQSLAVSNWSKCQVGSSGSETGLRFCCSRSWYSESQEHIRRWTSLFAQVFRQHIPLHLPTPCPSKNFLPCLACQEDLSVSLEELGQIRQCQLETHHSERRHREGEVSDTRQVCFKDLKRKLALEQHRHHSVMDAGTYVL